MSDREIIAALVRIETRLAALEKHSHPPIDLAPAVREIVRAEVARARR